MRTIRLALVALVAGACGSAASVGAQIADDMRCYRVKDPARIAGVVDLESASAGLEPGCQLGKAQMYCTPVSTTVQSATGDGAPLDLLPISGPNPGDRVCYRVKCPQPAPTNLEISDRFAHRTFEKLKTFMLCVPAVRGAVPAEPASSGGMCLTSANAGDYILDCNSSGGYEVTSRIAPVESEPALRVLAMYETGATSGTGQATVHVARQERVVLVLSAYEQTNWTVTVAPGATLERVVLVGCESQTATVPVGIPVETAPLSLLGCGAFEFPSEDADLLIAYAEQATGLCLTSFHGCYDASVMQIPAAP